VLPTPAAVMLPARRWIAMLKKISVPAPATRVINPHQLETHTPTVGCS
jgi:hypothetical protein